MTMTMTMTMIMTITDALVLRAPITSVPITCVPCAQELRNFPFTWTDQLTAGIDGGSASLCAFLTRLGLHGQPMWSLECACGPKNILDINHPSADLPTSSSNSADGFRLDFINCPQKVSSFRKLHMAYAVGVLFRKC